MFHIDRFQSSNLIRGAPCVLRHRVTLNSGLFEYISSNLKVIIYIHDITYNIYSMHLKLNVQYAMQHDTL